jgi:hypothetical protein
LNGDDQEGDSDEDMEKEDEDGDEDDDTNGGWPSFLIFGNESIILSGTLGVNAKIHSNGNFEAM